MNKWQGQKILIVDDSAHIRQELSALYTNVGLKPIGEVSNGLEALKFIEKESPDLVSLDIIMPIMDGIECYHKIQDSYPRVKCMLVSCLSGEEKVIDAFKKSIPEYLFVKKVPTLESLSQHLDKIYP